MPGDMTIKSILLGEILEKLARMNITIRPDDDREEEDPVCSEVKFGDS
jgi:hypothetical protein